MSKSLTDHMADIECRVAQARLIPRAGPLQLPLWPSNLRGLPNSMARSALFTVGNNKTPRVQFQRDKIATVAGYEIFYTGTELRQDDEDVFLQIVHLARMHPLGDVVEVSGLALLRALGWGTGADPYNRLRNIIERLKEGTIKISHQGGKRGYAGSMIRKFAWQSDENATAQTKWKIYLEKEVVDLFADDEYSLLVWEERRKLGSLAQWLHSFFHTHREPLPYKVKTIYQLCGSRSASLSGFRRDLKKALDTLVDIGFLKHWKHTPEIDTISVRRVLTMK